MRDTINHLGRCAPDTRLEDHSIRTVLLGHCPVCAEPDYAHFASLRDHLHGIIGTFQYVRCSACNSIYQNPRVVDEDIAKCYPLEYFTHATPPNSAPRSASRLRKLKQSLRDCILHHADKLTHRRAPRAYSVLGWILAHSRTCRTRARFGLPDSLALDRPVGARCLEIGPGQGQTLRNLRLVGWNAIGLDIDPTAAKTAREVNGCEVFVGPVIDSHFESESFRLVYMSHVLEHLPDLKQSLEHIFTLLEPNGRLVIVYPNPNALTCTLDKQFSYNWDAPRHVTLPARGALLTLLTQLGFETRYSTTHVRFAARNRQVARKHRARAENHSFTDRLTISDRLFGFAEGFAVHVAGMDVGEEIEVVAYKRARTRNV